jgi:hypothetical protein
MADLSTGGGAAAAAFAAPAVVAQGRGAAVEDRTTNTSAGLLERQLGGFRPPPGP